MRSEVTVLLLPGSFFTRGTSDVRTSVSTLWSFSMGITFNKLFLSCNCRDGTPPNDLLVLDPKFLFSLNSLLFTGFVSLVWLFSLIFSRSWNFVPSNVFLTTNVFSLSLDWFPSEPNWVTYIRNKTEYMLIIIKKKFMLIMGFLNKCQDQSCFCIDFDGNIKQEAQWPHHSPQLRWAKKSHINCNALSRHVSYIKTTGKW